MATTIYQAAKQAGLRRTFARMQAKGLTILVTLQMGGTAGAYEPAANAPGTTYVHTKELQAFRYNATDATSQAAANQTAGAVNSLGLTGELLLIQGSDLPDDAEPVESDTVLIEGKAWDIKQVASVPLELIFILSIQRA